MATADEVVTILRADTSQHDARIAASAAQFEKKMAAMSAAAERVGNATSLIGIDPVFDKFAAGANKGANAMDKLGKASKATNLELRYLPAQLNDIGVQLAGGQSPFLIALQQGTQINQALGGMGLRGTISALGSAFVGLLNPIGLATIAFIGVGGTAIQYFTNMLSMGEDSAEVLKKQAQLIQQVADKWGEALPALKAYADEQKRLSEETDRAKAVQAATNGILDAARSKWADVQNAAGPAIQSLAGSFFVVQKEMDILDAKIKDGTATTEDFAKVSSTLTELLGTDAVQGNSRLRNSIQDLRDSYLSAAKAAGILLAQQDALTGLPGKGNRLGTMSLDEAQAEFDRQLAQRRRLYPEDFPQNEPPKTTRTPRRRSRLDTGDRIDNDIEAIRARTEALKLEQSTLRDTFKEQTQRKTQFDLETKALKRLREEAQKKGVTDLDNIQLSKEQKDAIEQVSRAYAEQADQLRKDKEIYQFQRDVIKGTFDDVRSALEDGKITTEEWGDLFLNVLDKIIDKIENNLIDALLSAGDATGGIGGGGGGSLIGSIFKLFGFDKGGYTGDGNKHDPAGIVHRGEYVFDKASVQAAGGAGVLDAMRNRLKGYDSGGLVGMPTSLPISGASRGGPTSYAPSYMIDARGAQKGVGAEIKKALQDYDRVQAPHTWRRIASDQRAGG